jgi:UDP-N-acetylmuramoylalanine--D-glutamate ligase
MRIAILGFEREGQSVLKFISKRREYKGAEIWILDRDPKLPARLAFGNSKAGGRIHPNAPSIKLRTGKNYLRNLHEFDLIFRSPGIRYNLPELKKARKDGIRFSSATKLFFENSPTKNIIGVTGTKGKGTTSTLIYKILQAAGKRCFIGGNIGEPPLNFIHKIKSDDWVVLELSSFQLIDIEKSPHVAVVLMVTSEHLDWHTNLKEYIDAKARIVNFQSSDDYAVFARDYSTSISYAKKTKAQVFTFSKDDEPARGTWIENNYFWFSDGKREERIVATSDLKLPGEHNWDNAMAAIAVAKILKIDNDDIEKTIKNFKGLEHRLEFVAIKNGVRYYNDSYSTTPETAIVAIEAFDDPKILILGGSGKKSDFRKLGQVISKSKTIKAIIGIDSEWPRIKSKISFSKRRKIQIIEKCRNMKQILRATEGIATSGDIVLLSPACASFGMFKNHTDRGDQFKKIVKLIKTG